MLSPNYGRIPSYKEAAQIFEERDEALSNPEYCRLGIRQENTEWIPILEAGVFKTPNNKDLVKAVANYQSLIARRRVAFVQGDEFGLTGKILKGELENQVGMLDSLFVLAVRKENA